MTTFKQSAKWNLFVGYIQSCLPFPGIILAPPGLVQQIWVEMLMRLARKFFKTAVEGCVSGLDFQQSSQCTNRTEIIFTWFTDKNLKI